MHAVCRLWVYWGPQKYIFHTIRRYQTTQYSHLLSFSAVAHNIRSGARRTRLAQFCATAQMWITRCHSILFILIALKNAVYLLWILNRGLCVDGECAPMYPFTKRAYIYIVNCRARIKSDWHSASVNWDEILRCQRRRMLISFFSLMFLCSIPFCVCIADYMAH